MRDTRYLKRRVGRRRSGDRWYVRVPIPTDLRGRFGKLEAIERGLGTGDLREAQRRRHAVVGEILETFDRARAGRPEDAAAEEFTRAYAAWRQVCHERRRRAVHEQLGVLLDQQFMPIDGEEHVPAPCEKWQERARKALCQCGIEPAPEVVERLAESFLEAQVDATDAMLEGRDVAQQRPNNGAALRIAKAGKSYMIERQRDPNAALSKQTAAQVEATFRLFADFTGDARLDEVRRQDAAGFLDTIAGLHRHYGRQRGAADLSLQQLLKKYPAGDGEGLSNKTLNRHLSALSGLFRWARRRGHLPEDRPNPFSEQMRPKGDNPWLPFTIDELNGLFAGLEFEIRPKRHSLATARPWVMAVALFSGMREGEVCGLEAENVQKRDGVVYFDVTKSKSQAGVRLIPVHSELVKLGFLEYIAAIGKGPLFPGITPGSRGGGRAHTFAKRFPEFRRKRGVSRGRLSFHSFRKNFVRALELAGVDRDRAALVVGHERGFTFRVYNPEGVDVAALRQVVEAVRYSGLDLRGKC